MCVTVLQFYSEREMETQNRHAHYSVTLQSRKTPAITTLRLSPTTTICIVLFTFFTIPTTTCAKEYPCPYSQTVNITDGLRLKDGSYSFEGLIIPANLTAEYKIKIIDGIEYSAPKHWRGCACLLKPCVTFCCAPKMHYDEKHHNCSLNEKDGHSQHTHIEVTFGNGTTSALNIKDTFIVRYEFGCQNKIVERKRNEFWKWDLFEVSMRKHVSMNVECNVVTENLIRSIVKVEEVFS